MQIQHVFAAVVIKDPLYFSVEHFGILQLVIQHFLNNINTFQLKYGMNAPLLLS